MSEDCKIFIGNLSYKCNTNDLYDRFGQYGKVEDAIVITDRDTGRSRGFGFVTFADKDEADAAIQAEHESDFMGRDITVRKAESRRQGGGGGGGYSGGRRDNYGGGGRYGNRGAYDEGYQSYGGGNRGGNDGYRGGGGYRGGNDGYRGGGGY